jgi:choline dehydrogenase
MIFNDTFDYIVVGLGAAGGVIASRLIQAGYYVALVDAGGDFTENEKVKTPGDLLLLYDHPSYQPPYDPPYDQWSFRTYGTKDKKNTFVYPRGVGFGGSTNHHAMVMFRGSRLVFDEWASITGDQSWAYEGVLPYFKKMETCEYAKPGDPYRGTDGWLHLTKIEPEAMDFTYLKACQKKGIPINHEQNGDPEKVLGAGYWDASIKNGERSYVGSDLIVPTLKQHSNYKLFLYHLVTKVLVEKDAKGSLKTTGLVAVEQKYAYKADTQNQDASIGKEKVLKGNVILCGGGINSPQLLMLSGIGPKEHLESVGVPCVLDKPGVGQNLLDHIEVSVIYEITKNWHPRWNDAARYPELARDIYDIQKKGPLASNGVACGFDWHVPSGEKNPLKPDIHSHQFYTYLDTYDIRRDYCLAQKAMEPYMNRIDPNLAYRKEPCALNEKRVLTPVVTNLIEVCHPHAKGYMRLQTKNPFDVPYIQQNLDNDRDLTVLAEGVLLVRSIFNDEEFKGTNPPHNVDYGLKEVIPGPQYQSKEQLKEFFKKHSAYGHHISGACRMGRKEDPMAVVDSHGCVIGVEGLFVADASIMPTICSANPTNVINMMGEKLADDIMRYGLGGRGGRRHSWFYIILVVLVIIVILFVAQKKRFNMKKLLRF